jgi:hypothetical protein
MSIAIMDKEVTRTSDKEPRELNIPADTRDQILGALAGIRFGSVEITIHQGRIVQIERREKLRPAFHPL